MIGYLDTSAFVPLLVTEPTSEACRRFWDASDTVVSTTLLHVETSAALAQARRLGRLSTPAHRAALKLLERLWPELELVQIGELTVRHASGLANRLALRGYDAVHCASAVQLADLDLVAASGDRQLLGAWNHLGLATYDTAQP